MRNPKWKFRSLGRPLEKLNIPHSWALFSFGLSGLEFASTELNAERGGPCWPGSPVVAEKLPANGNVVKRRTDLFTVSRVLLPPAKLFPGTPVDPEGWADEHPVKGKTCTPFLWGTLWGSVIQHRRDQTKLYSLIKIITHTSARRLGQKASEHSSGSGLLQVLPDLKIIIKLTGRGWAC